LTDQDWITLITTACAARPTATRLVTFVGPVGDSFAFPAAFSDATGVEYVVKSPSHGEFNARAVATEQVVSAIGRAIGVPVAEVRLVELPQELLDLNPEQLKHFEPGVCHGSRHLPNVRESRRLLHTDRSENRPRFAALAALFGWSLAADHQFLYGLTPPHPVYSHDHGQFLAGRFEWTPATLAAAAAAVCDPLIVTGCTLTADELQPELARVAAVEPAVVAGAVAMPPDAWGVTLADRIALAKYLESRQADLAAQNSRM
jgi:hypothetical protein